jgi:hypothetical protein
MGEWRPLVGLPRSGQPSQVSYLLQVAEQCNCLKGAATCLQAAGADIGNANVVGRHGGLKEGGKQMVYIHSASPQGGEIATRQ